MKGPCAYLLCSIFLPLFLFHAAPSAFAETGSVPAALQAVEGFYAGITAETKDLGESAAVKDFRKRALEEKDRVHAQIRSIDWAETPGKKRFEKIYKFFDSYTVSQIASVKGLAMKLPGDKARIEEAIKRLTELKAGKIKELNEASKNEVTEEKKIKPVPVIDRSPFEKEPDSDKGIWYR